MKHIPGLELSAYFFHEAIKPLMAAHFPEVCYSAARLGYGSDVLGFDTAMSMDHGWGPKMTLFLNPEDYTKYRGPLDHVLAHHLPFTIHGFPTHFDEPLSDGGVMSLKKRHPIRHMVHITTPGQFFQDYLRVDIHHPMAPVDWLTLPQQRLRTLRAGRIYHDGLGRMEPLRRRFDWYPPDVWRYLLANQWLRIDQDEPFIGRTASVGDELGSRLLTGRLVRDMISLAFLMEQEYAPYRKWFGSAFKQLKSAKNLLPVLKSALDAQHWKTREKRLNSAAILLAHRHNALGLTSAIPAEVSNFHNRPFLVIHASRFVTALLNSIEDSAVKTLPSKLGSLDQIADNTDLLEDLSLCQKLQCLYDDSEQPQTTKERSDSTR
jgi:hypothetical protein